MNKNKIEKADHFFHGRGKLLLTGEYFILDGAQGIALPTTVGQSMSVKYSPSYSPSLHWKSLDVNGNVWLEANFEFWHFNCLDEKPSKEILFLQKILCQARSQNTHFLRDEVDVFVETKLEFPVDWGLGSSSTLIYNMAQWAYTSPFELSFKTQGGSGYDIACAQTDGPVIYEKKSNGPHWSPVTFNPEFKENLYFVYLGRKQNTRQAISYYEKNKPESSVLISEISDISNSILSTSKLEVFDDLLEEHEKLVSSSLQLERAKDTLFPDYWGQIKSMGAWGGDIVLVTSKESPQKTMDYFVEKGFNTFIPYSQLVYDSVNLQ